MPKSVGGAKVTYKYKPVSLIVKSGLLRVVYGTTKQGKGNETN